MTFDLGQVVIRTDSVKQALADTRAGLQQTQAASADAAESLGKLGEAAGKAGQAVATGMQAATSSVGATGQAFGDFFDKINSDQARVLGQIKGPWELYQADLRATNALFEAGKLSMGEFEGASARLADRLEVLQQRNLSPQLRLEIDLYEQITDPIKRYEQELAALNSILNAEQISLEQYDAALAKVQRRAEAGGVIAPTQGPAFKPDLAGLAEGSIAGPAYDQFQAGKGVSEELQRERNLLEQLQAPLREYEAQLRTLDSLLAKESITLDQYNDHLARAQRRAEAGGALAPVQGPTFNADQAGKGNGLTDKLQGALGSLGPTGSALSQISMGGAAAAAGMTALVAEIKHAYDEYTTLANKVERFTTSDQSATDILRGQLEVSKELHSSLASTLELYVRVRETTNELNLSQREQLQLAHDIGVDVAAEGKGAESAAALTQRLSIAFETGTVSGRELRALMKQYPDILNAFSDSLGHSSAELVQMANKGQVSAQQLIDALHKIAPEAEATLGRMNETFTQKAGHLADWINVNLGAAIDWYKEQYESTADIAMANFARDQKAQRDAQRQLTEELEKNARTAAITGAAGGLGIKLPGFDQESADAITRMRMTARQAGIDISDAFADAKGQAQQYSTQIERIKEQHAAKDIADDAKRIYEALYGVGDLLKDQAKHWRDLGDESNKLAGAIAKLQATRLVSGAPQAQDERDLLLKQQTTDIERDYGQKYDKAVVGYAQGLKTAREELDSLNRAAKDGVIAGDALRQKQDQLLTILNDGRLPEAIKIWESISLPIQQAARDLTAANALFRSGRIDVEDYTAELKKVADTHKNGDALLLSDGVARINQQLQDGLLTWGQYDNAVKKVIADFNTLHTTASGIQYRIAPQGPEGPTGLLPQTYKKDYLPSVTDNAELKSILAQVQSPDVGDGFKTLNDEMERANKLADEFVAPSVKYEQRLEDIAGALSLNAITEDQATAARRRAKETLNEEEEALASTKGPLEQYNAALRKLKDQLDDNFISQKQFATGVDKARTAMLEATGQADTFSGAMELAWIGMKDSADKFGGSVAKLVTNDLDKFNDAIVTAANGGQVSWSQMADSMIQDLERLALKMLEIQALQAIFGAVGSGSGASGGGDALNAAIGAGSLIGKLAGYATGGDYVVGGSGGTDSQLQAFWATPGERVTITPPGAYPFQQTQSAGSTVQAAPAPAPIIQVHNHYDKSIALGAIGSPDGQSAIVNVLRANAPAVRSALGIRDR